MLDHEGLSSSVLALLIFEWLLSSQGDEEGSRGKTWNTTAWWRKLDDCI